MTGSMIVPGEIDKGIVFVGKDITEQNKTEKENQKHIREMEVFYKASIGREERILELKRKVAELEREIEEKM